MIEIATPECANNVLSKLMNTEVEEFWALALGPSKRLLKSAMIFRGTVDACLVHPRDVFRFACVENASSLVIAHNHPSGDSKPSDQDLVMTRELVRVASLIQIPILDHLILVADGFTSLAREGWCRFSDRQGRSQNGFNVVSQARVRKRVNRLPENGRFP